MFSTKLRLNAVCGETKLFLILIKMYALVSFGMTYEYICLSEYF